MLMLPPCEHVAIVMIDENTEAASAEMQKLTPRSRRTPEDPFGNEHSEQARVAHTKV
jgi:hypothetical protein